MQKSQNRLKFVVQPTCAALFNGKCPGGVVWLHHGGTFRIKPIRNFLSSVRVNGFYETLGCFYETKLGLPYALVE